MKTIELFSGTQSFSKVMSAHGHSTFTLDKDKNLEPDMIVDLLTCGSTNILFWGNDKVKDLDFLWASPPCTGFSVAAIGKSWNSDMTPKSQTAADGLQMLRNTMRIIRDLKPKYWCIENPRGMMRVVFDELARKYDLDNYHRVTVTYCQYGDTRMKPTDIWTNIPNWQGKCCKNGATCHVAAPRGSRTGTQGLKSAKERGVIPPALFEEILQYVKI